MYIYIYIEREIVMYIYIYIERDVCIYGVIEYRTSERIGNME